MAGLRVRGLTVRRDGRAVLRDVSLDAPPGRLSCVLGLAGAGKTSLLAAIAGLLPSTCGAVLVGGTDIARTEARHRGVGLLAPGTTLAHGRTVRGALTRLAGAAPTAGSLVEMLDLGGFAERRTRTLSHGEAALALAAARLLPPGAVLLADEAGAGLDDMQRTSLIAALRAHAGAGTVLMATRCRRVAQDADHLVLLADGCVLQEGRPALLYAEPRCASAARLTGPANILEGVVREKRPGGFVWAAGARYLQAAGSASPALGEAVRLCLRPERVALLHSGDQADNVAEGAVIGVRPGWGVVEIEVMSRLGPILAYLPAWGAAPPPAVGDAVRLGWAAHAAWLLERKQPLPSAAAGR